MENVYPKIKEYCRERHGLEFQVSVFKYKYKHIPVCMLSLCKPSIYKSNVYVQMNIKTLFQSLTFANFRDSLPEVNF